MSWTFEGLSADELRSALDAARLAGWQPDRGVSDVSTERERAMHAVVEMVNRDGKRSVSKTAMLKVIRRLQLAERAVALADVRRIVGGLS